MYKKKIFEPYTYFFCIFNKFFRFMIEITYLDLFNINFVNSLLLIGIMARYFFRQYVTGVYYYIAKVLYQLLFIITYNLRNKIRFTVFTVYWQNPHRFLPGLSSCYQLIYPVALRHFLGSKHKIIFAYNRKKLIFVHNFSL